jgi:hypothetical protein
MVYVDQPSRRYVSKFRAGVFVSWLVADEEAELHAFAAGLDLRREWCLTNRYIRYELGSERRRRAIEHGATELSVDEFVAWLARHLASRSSA